MAVEVPRRNNGELLRYPPALRGAYGPRGSPCPPSESRLQRAQLFQKVRAPGTVAPSLRPVGVPVVRVMAGPAVTSTAVAALRSERRVSRGRTEASFGCMRCLHSPLLRSGRVGRARAIRSPGPLAAESTAG